MRRSSLILLASLSLSLSLSLPAFGASWVKSGDNWTYVDDNNNRVYNEWKKGADNEWRYLGNDGFMSINKLVDDERYYVNAEGLIITNSWKKIDDSWYYFDNTGKKVVNKWYKIDNKNYHFDYDGKMQTGWILDDLYYMSSDGVMQTGWQNLYPSDYDLDSENNGPDLDGEDNEKRWYYFGTNGKKYMPNNYSSAFVEKTINGKKYAFNEKGELVTGWVNIANTEPAIKGYKYYNSDGSVRTGWYSTEGPNDLADNGVQWYYFDSKGVPKASNSSKFRTSDFVKINNRQYIFNENGNPVSGFIKVYNSAEYYDIYYLGKAAESYVQKGKRTIEDSDGKSSYYFSESTGKAYTGVKNGYIYYKGKLQRAEEDSYIILSLPLDNSSSFTNYVVNKSGRVVKNAKVKNSDGTILKSNSLGILISIDNATTNIKDRFESVKEASFDNE